MGVRSTRTFAELELSATAYDEIATKLRAAGYEHAFMHDGAIDMHGIGVTREAPAPLTFPDKPCGPTENAPFCGGSYHGLDR